MGLVDWVRAVRALATEERRRGVSIVGDRAYVEFRGIGEDQLPAFAEAIEERLPELGEVRSHDINPFTRRVGLRFASGVPTRRALEAFVDTAERALTAQANGPSVVLDSERVLPDDEQLELQRAVEAIADAAGLSTALVLKLLPIVPRAMGANAAGIIFLVQNIPSLRRPLDERLGRERADFVLTLALSSAYGFGQRPLSALVGLTSKLVSLRELRARRELWEAIAPEWGEDPASPEDLQPQTVPRPVRLPRGPVEKHADRVRMMAAGTFGVSLATTRNPARAVAAGFAALPTPAWLGRELYCSELGRLMAQRGTLALAPDALRRLDRVDCLVLPAELMSREKFAVGEVFGHWDLSKAEARVVARRLFSPDHPLRVQKSEDGYALGPLKMLPVHASEELQQRAEEHAQRGALVLALSKGGDVCALLEVRVAPQRGNDELIDAARRAGMRVVLASDDVSATEAHHPDEVIPGGEGLANGIRRLQAEGHTVCFASRGPSPGLAVADIGVGLRVAGLPTPWGAHIITADDPLELATLVHGCTAARTVSAQSVRLAMGAAAVGTLVSAGGVTLSASRRVMFVVNGVSMVSMLNGLRRSAAVGRELPLLVDPTPWHALEAPGVLARLGSRPEGLAHRSLPLTRQTRVAKRSSSLAELAGAIRAEALNPLAPLLAAGAGLSAAVGSMADAGIVAGVGGVNALIGGVQRFRTERAIHQLVDEAQPRVRVRRDGEAVWLGADELVRGDVVILGQGDLVPADCRILEADALEVDASSLTGESLPVLKSAAPSFAENLADRSSMLYAGTTVAAGRASAIVVALGEETAAQRGVTVAAPDEMRGGVEERLRQLMRMTGPVAAAAGTALVAGGLLRGRRVDDLVSTGVSLAVAAVPEGLPLLATAAQLSAAERLSQRGALVRNPRCIEALGRVDVICLDKTGTLTEGRIELGSIHDGAIEEEVHELSGARRDVLRAALRSVTRADDGSIADPTDSALAGAAKAASVGASDNESPFERVAERAFESGRGYQAVLGNDNGKMVLLVKGAPESILPRCSRYAPDGESVSMPQSQEKLLATVASLASRGLRVIAIAEGGVDKELDTADEQACDGLLADPGRLTLLGLLAFRDPVRSSSAEGIVGLRRAGVRVVMLTGDHPSTAEHVAREVGLLSGGRVVGGAGLSRMSDAQLEAALEDTVVFARVTPAQKVRVVRALQRAGRVVAMVGDGANDAPALRLSDVGIAVGKRSTPAARNAADIVLADARMHTLVDAIVEGRAMWISVRDAVSILVGGNLGEIGFTVAVGGVTGRPPLSPRQLLLVNFLTDIAPAMAIALRPPTIKNMQQLAQEGPDASLGSPLNRDIVSRAIVTAMGAGGAWTVGRLTGGRSRARTIALAALVGSQLGQTLRTGGLNRPVLLTSIGSFAALAGVIQMPGLSQVFGCRPLGPIAWSIAVGAAGAATAAGYVVDPVVHAMADILGATGDEDVDLNSLGVRVPDNQQQAAEQAAASRLLN